MCSRMRRQDPRAGALADAAALILARVAQEAQALGAASRDEDLLARAEEMVESLPPVADHRCGAGGRLEQPDARRPPGADHVGAGDVEGEALGGIEPAMLARRQV